MRLIPEWRSLWKALTMHAAALGIFTPELLQVVADNSNLLPWLDASVKDSIRLGALIAIVVLRPIRQKSVSGA